MKRRWEEYIKELSNHNSCGDMMELDVEVDRYKIKIKEIEYAIQWMNKGKATGQDGIAAEMLKILGQNGKKKCFDQVNCHKNF